MNDKIIGGYQPKGEGTPTDPPRGGSAVQPPISEFDQFESEVKSITNVEVFNRDFITNIRFSVDGSFFDIYTNDGEEWRLQIKNCTEDDVNYKKQDIKDILCKWVDVLVAVPYFK